MTKTYWQGSPVVTRRVRVRIGKDMPPSYWCAELTGLERDALEIHTPTGVVLIDDQHGAGWAVITSSHTSGGGYRRLPPDSVVLSERPSNT